MSYGASNDGTYGGVSFYVATPSPSNAGQKYAELSSGGQNVSLLNETLRPVPQTRSDVVTSVEAKLIAGRPTANFQPGLKINGFSGAADADKRATEKDARKNKARATAAATKPAGIKKLFKSIFG